LVTSRWRRANRHAKVHHHSNHDHHSGQDCWRDRPIRRVGSGRLCYSNDERPPTFGSRQPRGSTASAWSCYSVHALISCRPRVFVPPRHRQSGSSPLQAPPSRASSINGLAHSPKQDSSQLDGSFVAAGSSHCKTPAALPRVSIARFIPSRLSRRLLPARQAPISQSRRARAKQSSAVATGAVAYSCFLWTCR
jgi:hypothetical protein